MTNTNDRTAGDAAAASDRSEIADLQADIERTRGELAETVDQLAAKLDVKTRVRDQMSYTLSTTKEAAAHQYQSLRDKATGPDGRPTPVALSVAGGVLAALAAVVLLRLRTGSRGR